MGVLETIMSRRSVRKFTLEAVTADEREALARAALCAPTSKNCRSWEFVFVDAPDIISALSRAKSAGAEFLAGAGLAVAVLGDTSKTDAWIEDASIAAAYIQLEAKSLGLGSCWAQMHKRTDADGGDASRNVCRLLGAPENCECLCVIGIGRPAEERRPYEPDKLKREHLHTNKFSD